MWAHRGARTGPVHLTASGGVHRRRHRGDGGNPNVCPALHMPLQSGSDRILRAMRRSYRVERYLGIIDRVRAAIPHAAITTDVIVGFPGETEEDFTATLELMRRVRFAGAFTFQYSKRPAHRPRTSTGRCPKILCKNAING
ncbi:radical SAM superfamily protein [Mycobacterium xenopi 4042]|uniref:Radical SAM superfamily protein n=1 Tax=Mycobacterium xenopi 4042 TaxID=1299334 RepID=X8CE75_MYCXE|nr:radical SAM superfamily protein [Mycobacterium xenopi 4042]